MSPLGSPIGCFVTRVSRGDGALVTLRGNIDQTFESRCLSQLTNGSMAIDLEGVNRVTSFGIREWCKAIQLVSAPYIGFIKVKPSMVTQFNVVAGASGNGEIVTLYAPFICSSCGSVFEKLYDLRTEFEELTSAVNTHVPCPQCAAPSELDELPSVYLNFVMQQGPANPPPDFERVIDLTKTDFKQDNQPGANVQQEVEGNISFLWLTGTLDKRMGLRRIVQSLEGTVVVLLRHVTEFAAVSADQLEFLRSYDRGLLYFAQVPPSLQEAIGPQGTNLKVASWFLSRLCTGCGVTHEFELSRDSELPKCASCGAHVREDAEIALLRSQTLSLPNDIRPSILGRNGPRKPVGRGQFLSQFEIIRSIGKGGMGEVFLAHMRAVGSLERQVALKCIHPSSARDPAALEMFLSEAQLAARLSHPNIVQIFDVGHERGKFYMAMEYVDGCDLKALCDLSRNAELPIPTPIALTIAAEIAAGLSAAHTHVSSGGALDPIVHRDISPHNILLAKTGEIKITDFGIAKMESDPNRTPVSGTKGKLLYLAPEQIVRKDLGTKGQRVDPRSDIFSLGIVLYQTLTGSHPFVYRNDAYEIMKAIVEDDLPSVARLRDDVPTAVDEIIARATAKNLNDRYPSALHMRNDLLAAIGPVLPSVGAWVMDALQSRGVVPDPSNAETSTRLNSPLSQSSLGTPEQP
jgi:serine/threonine protein kinase